MADDAGSLPASSCEDSSIDQSYKENSDVISDEEQLCLAASPEVTSDISDNTSQLIEEVNPAIEDIDKFEDEGIKSSAGCNVDVPNSKDLIGSTEGNGDVEISNTKDLVDSIEDDGDDDIFKAKDVVDNAENNSDFDISNSKDSLERTEDSGDDDISNSIDAVERAEDNGDDGISNSIDAVERTEDNDDDGISNSIDAVERTEDNDDDGISNSIDAVERTENNDDDGISNSIDEVERTENNDDDGISNTIDAVERTEDNDDDGISNSIDAVERTEDNDDDGISNSLDEVERTENNDDDGISNSIDAVERTEDIDDDDGISNSIDAVERTEDNNDVGTSNFIDVGERTQGNGDDGISNSIDTVKRTEDNGDEGISNSSDLVVSTEDNFDVDICNSKDEVDRMEDYGDIGISNSKHVEECTEDMPVPPAELPASSEMSAHVTSNNVINDCCDYPLKDSATAVVENLVNHDEASIDEEKKVSAPKDNASHLLNRVFYSGFKKKQMSHKISKPEKRIVTRGNPFNPLWKKESKLVRSLSDSEPNVVDPTLCADPIGINIQDCTHYLGLQPSINFRCNHCGISGFESIQMLNIHQVECRKVLGHSTSTNIKITRKVYLCSACGTYYESWHLFYHMRKVHEKFMCLYCLSMFAFSDKLCEHLMAKHQVNFINFPDFESFKKCNLSSYLFLCLECDNVMSDCENFRHTCSPQKTQAKVVPKPVQGISVPCVGTVTVVGAPSKRASQDSTATSKSKSNDNFVSDPSDFCHVDMNSPRKVKTPEPPPPPVEPVKEPPAKPQGILSEFPKIDLLPPKNLYRENSISDKLSESPGSVNNFDESPDHSELFKSEKKEKRISVKVKPVKRPRGSSSRQTKRAKLNPEQQKTALDKLTETINAVAKNYQVRESSPPPLSLNDSFEDKLIDDEASVADFEPLPLYDKLKWKEEAKENKKEEVNENIPANGTPDKPPIWKSVPDKIKFKLRTDVESDEDSDDSNKLSMAIDDTPAHSDNDSKAAKFTTRGPVNTTSDDSSQGRDFHDSVPKVAEYDASPVKPKQDEIALAGEDIPSMALTLDDKVEDVKATHILKECVRTSCMSCNYCRRAVKIAVNGKYLALHVLSEHRYTPTKSDSPEDVINKLKSSLEELSSIYFNTESYDSSDTTIHVPYDEDTTFDCFQCSFFTHSHKDLYIHKRKSHTKSLLLCIMCKINFYSYSELLCHLCPGHYDSNIQINNVDINFRCCFCQLDTIPSAFRLMVHLRKCHHTCDICLEICSDQQKLSTHMWKHKLNHLCYRCGIAYASKLDITKHLFWKHGTESVLCKKCLQKKWPHVYHFCIPPTSFLCEECNSSFSKAVALKVHKRVHAGDFSYHCTQCDKKFVSKKLLQKHEDQHNNPVEPPEVDGKSKEEIIDVTGESTGNADGVVDSLIDENNCQKGSDKENETGKHHKKHKKDKKGKQVIDVYDLPPLNLSSDSDSTDDESTKNTTNEPDKDQKEIENKVPEAPSSDKENSEPVNENAEQPFVDSAATESVPDKQDPELATLENQETEPVEQSSTEEITDPLIDTNSTDAKFSNNSELSKTSEEPGQNTSIWENFYKINSNNKNLPYPLCAMRTEDAYKIIMGDHDYCLQAKVSDPVIKEDLPTQSILEENKMDLTNALSKTELSEATASDSSPTKKKQKSPKKKANNNSSSSSDSSSDSDSSSCSCGDNCSCSSSSSDSSSSSSSDSDSSASDTANKQRADKRKKRKEKKSKSAKHSSTVDCNGENKTIVESAAPAVPEEPAIRESDLETEESSTDEEFYDRQPQKITNQLLAEKRNQLMLLASVAPVHGEGLGHELTKSSVFSDTFSEPSGTAPSTPDPVNPSAKKANKARRRKKFMLKSRKRVVKNYTFNNISQPSETLHKAPKPFNLLKLKEPKRPEKPLFEIHTPPSVIRSQLTSDVNSGAGSENESVRSSKRKRVPNKFYGYSSGEEEERIQSQKWRKPETLTPPPPPLPPPPPPPVITTPKFVHTMPQTPKIQLSVPKQIIRKNQTESPKVRHYLSGNDSTDSSSDNDKKFSHPSKAHPAMALPHPPSHSSKQDKNLYCYCRCPYDEVSEMIACDDDNCKIEWFHFECVGISVPPKGQWFCPQCLKKRGILP